MKYYKLLNNYSKFKGKLWDLKIHIHRYSSHLNYFQNRLSILLINKYIKLLSTKKTKNKMNILAVRNKHINFRIILLPIRTKVKVQDIAKLLKYNKIGELQAVIKM